MSSVVLSSDSPSRPPVAPSALLLVGGAVFGAVVVGLYRQLLLGLPRIWEQDPNYSHGYLIPAVVAWFAFRAWKRHGLPVPSNVSPGEVFGGVLRILTGLLLHGICQLVVLPLLDTISLVLVVLGALTLVGGRSAERAYGFAFWFLIFAAPLPRAVYQPVALFLQESASAFSEVILQAANVPVFRQGCYLSIPGFEMEVGQACSGMRQLTAIVAMSLAIGHLGDRSRGFRWTLALSALPIAVLANCIRVSATAFILLWFGSKWAEGFYHSLEGLVVIGLATVLLLFVASCLDVLFSPRTASDEDEAASEESTVPQPV